MLSVLLAVFILVSVGMFLWNYFDKYDDHDGTWRKTDPSDTSRWWVRGAIAITATITAVALFIAIMCLIPQIATAEKYDTQISIIEEENAQMEEQICDAVERYMQHEENIYDGDLNINTALSLLSTLYPNLKSDALMQSLIETYQHNTKEIKELKLKQTELVTKKFLVYFGH